ncbi:MAG: M36 family metallopeptidase [Blastocatellia bacterium]
MRRTATHQLPTALLLAGLLALSVIAGGAGFMASLSLHRNPQNTAAQTSTQAPRKTRERRATLPALENFDIRADLDTPDHAPQTPGRDKIAIHLNSLTHTPDRLYSGARGRNGAKAAGPGSIARDPETQARAFLRENNDLYKLTDHDLAGLQLRGQETSAHNGVTHLTLEQRVADIAVFQGQLRMHLDRGGNMIAANGALIPMAAAHTESSIPQITAADALRLAAQYAGIDDASSATPGGGKGREQAQSFAANRDLARESAARLVWFPLAADQLVLAWEFELWPRDTADAYIVLVDAGRGSLLYRHNLTAYDENPRRPHGLVFTGDSPRPDAPHSSDNPAITERQDKPFQAESFNGAAIFPVTDPHFDWWAGADASALVSNNVDAHLDRDANNLADLPRLNAANGDYSFPLNLTQDPYTETNQKAAQANLFYWVNRYHDILYLYGFTETAGNFQANNFQRGGAEADAVQADAQDGSGTNNANFSTPPDGRPGRMQMFLWSGTPQLDGDLDQTVILHELTHGLSNRLIGNGLGLSGFQARGMGEGWSDFVALTLLRQENDPLDDAYAIGQYVRNDYVRGIRRFPYSTQKIVYPYTFANLSLSSSVHAAGEIWCVTLWEMRAALLRKYGFQAGTRQTLQLVVDGMKLTPLDPAFTDARDAILLADRVNNNGANQCLLWESFARRGLGWSASTLGVNDNAPREAGDLPPYCNDTGSIQLDRRNYVTGEAIRITVGDRNAAAPVTVQVRTSATADQETITLTADPVFPGSYTGAIRLAPGHAQLQDRLLQAAVDAGDQITVTYQDRGDAGGGVSAINAGAGVVREKTMLDDRVENGNQGWIATGGWTITRSRAASATHCWTDSPAGDYGNNADTTLLSPVLDLSNLSDVTLSFAHSHNLETRYDYGIVEYSLDEGATWTRAAAFTGVQTGFVQARVSLDALSEKSTGRFRFRLLSDQTQTADGWYIDDIRVTARSASPAVIKPGAAHIPVISAITPAYGPLTGGTSVTISGENFTETADTTLTFGDLPAANVRVISATTITALVPAHAAGTVPVRVTNRHGSGALTDGFTCHQTGSGGATPVLDRIFPSSGSLRGGASVFVLGDKFTPETRVTFGAGNAVVTFINPHTLQVTTPAAAATGAVDVTASAGASTATLSRAFTYTSATPPVVQVISPDNAAAVFIGATMGIRWESTDNSALARHRLTLVAGTGAQPLPVMEIAGDLPGDTRSFNWTIPASLNPAAQLRIRVIATDDEGSETTAFSPSLFSLARRWESMAALPFPFQRLAAVSDGQYIYAISGRSTSSNTTTVETVSRYEVVTNTWTTNGIAPMPMGLSSGDAVILNGKIHIPGGFSAASSTPAQQHFAYDTGTNTWTLTTAVPAATYFYALAADPARGVFYMTGGANSLGGPVGLVRAFNPQTGVWTDLPPMKNARYGHEAALIEGKLYVAGGFGVAGGLNSAEVFDFATYQWTSLANMNQARRFATSALGADQTGNPLWILTGGENPVTGAPLGLTEAYDARNNRWITLDPSFNQNPARTQLAGAVLHGVFYTIGGAVLQNSVVTTTTSGAVERMRIDALALQANATAPALITPGEQIATAHREIRFTVSASDLNAPAPLSLSITGKPASATFSNIRLTNNTISSEFRWTPADTDTGKTLTLTFQVSNGVLAETRTVAIRVVNTAPLAVVNAASYRGNALAPDAIVAAFGAGLAVRSESATTLPLPYQLAGTSVTVNGIPAPLFFVSPTQINFAMPPLENIGDTGQADVVVRTLTGAYSLGTVSLAPAQPALFSRDASGSGEASALATPDGAIYQQAPFDVTMNGKPNILVLYGTGFRNARVPDIAAAISATIGGVPARVLYAGAQGYFVGLDQLNIEIPPSLIASGASAPRNLEIVVSLGGVETNRVTIRVK